MSSSRVQLSKIPSLTFYKDAETLSRRGKPVPQLTCIGKPCSLYTPDVVRCQNAGGQGTDVDWKCEADLPEALRFGRVEVSCEGWTGPGDTHVLKGSCALEYRLVQIPDQLRKTEDHSTPPRYKRWIQGAFEDPIASVFTVMWLAVLVIMLYSFYKSCTGRRSSSGTGPRTNRPGPSSGPGWFSGNPFSSDHHDAPPPYSKYGSAPTSEGWRPGFWTGAALGGLGAHVLNNRRRTTAYDWENERFGGRGFQPPPAAPRSRFSAFDRDDRGEGSSNLGAMRSSVGLGGSNVR